jgi:aryl-alcohol dehydrogenase-like predicted oxidoreductase
VPQGEQHLLQPPRRTIAATWAAEFECTTWAQFSLQYRLANPTITCVLTETSNPHHMEENARTAFAPVRDATARQRMRAFIDAV